MKPTIRVAQLLVRLIGATMVVLGLLFWSGNALSLIQLHMLLGLVLVVLLWLIAVLALRTGAHPGLVALALVWGLIVPIVGLTQDRLLLSPLHWLIQVLHLAVGLIAIGLAEVLARHARFRHPPVALREAPAS